MYMFTRILIERRMRKKKRGREIIDIQIDSPVTAERLPHQDV